MNDSCVSLEDILAAASGRSASLVPETAGYLTLGIADAASRMPVRLDPRDIAVSVDGDVTLLSRGESVSPLDGARLLRERLAGLLAVSIGSLSSLSSAARARADGTRCVDDVAIEIESALIPINRAAARRALARLARETLRARESGALVVPPPAPRIASAPPPRDAAPQPQAAPPRQAEPPTHVSQPPRAATSLLERPMPAPVSPDARPSARPPSPGERRLEDLRDKRSRTRGWVIPSLPPEATLAAVIAAPLNLPKLSGPPRAVHPPASLSPPRAFVRPLAVIPRPVLRSSGAPNELRLGPGGVGEIWAPSNAVEVTGRIADPPYVADPAPPLVDLSPIPLDLPEASPSIAIVMTSSPDVAVAAIGVSESAQPPVLDVLESEEPPALTESASEEPPALEISAEPEPIEENISALTTAILGAAVDVIPFLDSALLEDDSALPLIDVEVAPPMDELNTTATPTIAMLTMPAFDELSEPTVLTETPHLLRITRPWPSAWRYEPTVLPREPAVVHAITPPMAFGVAPVERPAPVDEPAHVITAEPAPAPALNDEPVIALATEEPAPVLLEEHAAAPTDEPADQTSDELVTGALPQAPIAPSAAHAHADELLLRFGMSVDGDSSVKAAAKGLRALAGLDLTPSIAPVAVAPIHAPKILEPVALKPTEPAAPTDLLDPIDLVEPVDDETPPATSTPPISSPIGRSGRSRRFLVSAVAFAGGLAAATALVEVRPDFPDGVVALVAAILPD